MFKKFIKRMFPSLMTDEEYLEYFKDLFFGSAKMGLERGMPVFQKSMKLLSKRPHLVRQAADLSSELVTKQIDREIGDTNRIIALTEELEQKKALQKVLTKKANKAIEKATRLTK